MAYTINMSNADILAALENADDLSVITANSITVDAWASDSTYSDFSYKATIAIAGCTANHVPHVFFDEEQADSGDYAPVALTASGTVTIYAKTNDTITIPTIQLIKGGII